ncbi:ATP-binding protein [Deferrisoma palaeochoriense]
MVPVPAQPATVLVADDDRMTRQMAAHVLGRQGWTVVEAENGREALERFAAGPVDLVILDGVMPEMDGFEACRRIRALPQGKTLPILFVTALDDPESVDRALGAGATEYVTKPIHWAVLERRADHLVRLHRSERLLHLEQARTGALVRAAPDGVLTVDASGRITSANPSAGLLFGEATDRLAGRPVREFLPDLDVGAEPPKGPWETRGLAGGAAFPAEVSVGRYAVDDETGWVVLVRDITERKRAEAELREREERLRLLAERLQQANQELEAFTYTVSHDLRAPLRAMEGFAQALLEDCGEGLGDEGSEYAGRIVRAARSMDRLVRDLLEYSRLAREELRLEEVDLGAAVVEALEEFDRPDAVIRVEGPLPLVRGHRRMVVRAVGNLVGNALKFVPEGRRPEVTIRAEEQGGRVRLWVEDNGIGIPPEDQERIFGLFLRLHGPEAYPGTGLGLAIVRKAAERMGGRAGVVSEPGKGSRFWIELSAAREPDACREPVLDEKAYQRFRADMERVAVGSADTMVRIFLEEAGRQILAMRDAADRGDRETLTRAAHTLKSNARGLGALALAARCEALEKDPGPPETWIRRVEAVADELGRLRGRLALEGEP